MENGSARDPGSTVRAWVWRSFLGWIVGFLLMLPLLPLGDLVGGAQFPIGVGIGAGVGLVQGLFLRPWLGSPRRWTTASAVGMGLLFLVHDLLRIIGIHTPYHLPLYVVASALITGLLQARLLASAGARGGPWVAASLGGWGLLAGTLLLAESGLLPEAWGTALSLTGILLGGILVGAVQAPVMGRILSGLPLRGAAGS